MLDSSGQILWPNCATVRVLDDFSTGREENLTPFLNDIELVEGSVTEHATCRQTCQGMDFVLHHAALPSVERSVRCQEETHNVNATGTLNMLVASRDARVRRFVYAGSSSAYGDTPTLPKREDMTPNPRSPYAVSKLVGEQYACVFAEVFGLETITLRYFNVFGPNQDPNSQYAAVIPNFITCSIDGRQPNIYGDGEQTRDFTYVRNVVNANLLACHVELGGNEGEVFNVGCGERVSINALWEHICDLTASDMQARHSPARSGDVRHSLADLAKIGEALGYRAEVSLEEGLRRTWASFSVQTTTSSDSAA